MFPLSHAGVTNEWASNTRCLLSNLLSKNCNRIDIYKMCLVIKYVQKRNYQNILDIEQGFWKIRWFLRCNFIVLIVARIECRESRD